MNPDSPRKKFRLLWQIGYRLPNAAGVMLRHVISVGEYMATVGCVKPTCQLSQRRFSAAGLSYDECRTPRFEHSADEGDEPFIIDALAQQVDEDVVIDIVEEARHVDLDKPFDTRPAVFDLFKSRMAGMPLAKPL
ncbi:hypothetical protein GCM10011491_08620 [Brucella endophytica]|uniref:Uncharacterized protein n=1 Tax=Brucella endophytica TaxID=1963359 RepID=A0A916WAR7_9HYPH|nr:hypothetical protein GCM10011491_08620 [Brucella endophytica]